MKSGKYIKDRLYSMCIFVAMLIISVLMMAAFKVSVQLIIAEICIMIITTERSSMTNWRLT